MGEVDKIFDNFEMLYDGYMDMPEAQEARKSLSQYLVGKGIDIMEAECYFTSLISEYERQGFLYGFRYAVSLFLDGRYGVDGSNNIEEKENGTKYGCLQCDKPVKIKQDGHINQG